MRTILDGAAIEIDRPTVACAIASAAAVAQERGRIVVEAELAPGTDASALPSGSSVVVSLPCVEEG